MAELRPLKFGMDGTSEFGNGDVVAPEYLPNVAGFEVTYKDTTNGAAGMAVYMSGNGEVKLAKADAEGTTHPIGVLYQNAALNDVVRVNTVGVSLEMIDWTAVSGTASLVANAKYYLSGTSAGMLTSTAPAEGSGHYVARTLRAISTTKAIVDIGSPVRRSV